MGGIRGEKYVYNEENIKDITCSDPPGEMICVSLLWFCFV